MAGVEKRIEAIDFLRGSAALWVCWFHFTQRGTALLDDGVFEWSGRYGWLGVEIFFVISGFIIPYSMNRGGYTLKKFHIFLAKRVTRLDPPYLVSILLVLAVGFALTMAPNYKGEPFHINPLGLLFHLGYVNVLFGYEWLNPVYWTLAIEFQYYLLIGLAFPLVSTTERWKRVLLFGILSLLAWKITFGGYIFHFIFLFFQGMALFQYKAGLVGKAETLVMLGVFAGGTYLFLGLPFALAGIAAVCGISFLTVRHSVLTFLGSISYSLYLVHPPIGKIVFTLGRRFATSESAKVAITFAALGLAILAAYLLYVVVEGPSQRWSSSFKYKRPVAGEPESYVADINSSATEELAIP